MLKKNKSIQRCQELETPLIAYIHFLFHWFFCKIRCIFISSAKMSHCFEITPKCFKDLFCYSKNWHVWIVTKQRWMGSLGRANKYLDEGGQVKKSVCLHLEAEAWSLHIQYAWQCKCLKQGHISGVETATIMWLPWHVEQMYWKLPMACLRLPYPLLMCTLL